MEEASSACHKSQVEQRIPLTIAALEEKIDLVRGAVMICYPMGLPDYDFVRIALEDREELGGTSWANDDLDATKTAVWFAGKEMKPG